MKVPRLLRRFVQRVRERRSPEMGNLGPFGEEQARRFLRRRGYRILESNVTTPLGELDIIARKGSTLACVEVKARREGGPHDATDAISLGKVQRLKRCVEYIARRPAFRKLHPRLDAVFVTVHPDGTSAVEHVESIT